VSKTELLTKKTALKHTSVTVRKPREVLNCKDPQMTNATSTVITSHTHARARTHSLSVYDGTTLVGHLVRRDDSCFEAVDINGVGYGTFTTMKDAAFAIPMRSLS
jgi:hypothetical protein